jgi:hypothetical protein
LSTKAERLADTHAHTTAHKHTGPHTEHQEQRRAQAHQRRSLCPSYTWVGWRQAAGPTPPPPRRRWAVDFIQFLCGHLLCGGGGWVLFWVLAVAARRCCAVVVCLWLRSVALGFLRAGGVELGVWGLVGGRFIHGAVFAWLSPFSARLAPHSYCLTWRIERIKTHDCLTYRTEL